MHAEPESHVLLGGIQPLSKVAIGFEVIVSWTKDFSIFIIYDSSFLPPSPTAGKDLTFNKLLINVGVSAVMARVLPKEVKWLMNKGV